MSFLNTFFRKEQPRPYFVTKVILVTLLVLNATLSFIPPVLEFIIDKGIIYAVLIGSVVLIITQLDFVAADLAKSLSNPFEKNPVKTCTAIFRDIAKYDLVNIYIGVYNETLSKPLIEDFMVANHRINYYIHPKICDKVIPALNNANHTFFISRVPEDAIVIMCYVSDTCECVEILRPYQNNDFYSVKVKTDTEFINAFQQTYRNCYENTQKAIMITNPLILKLVTLFHKKNDIERTRLNENKKLIVTSRNDFFDYAVALIESAERSLLAVDFIPPELWISDPLVVAYADAHRGLKTFEKQRIHIYQTETLDAEKKAAYRNYIELMDTLNIELFFLEEKLMDTNQFEKRGSLIIDNCCCIIVINPDIGAKFGEIEFNQISIGDYEKRFRTLKKIAKPKADFQLLLT